ncbi:RNA methyltransferase [Putridiphycobacter roseus]|uniref:RNA methyltransferase n=1 Tax=Putridiphycobacter roseus TaxID=2219161 RepID=A0A2W1N0Y7_9FLAO|nr:RNA methyltransferase [Putridiphycobacter roseus]PZE17927.1 RNA methyltransferase [Putridiphycobacter roseus]
MSLTKNEIKFVKSLHQKKYRDSNQLFIVEGEKLIQELLSQKQYKIECIYHTQDYSITEQNEAFSTFLISKSDLERISNLKTPNKVLATVRFKEEEDLDLTKKKLVLLLDEVKDPGNLGTIIRTANWFGVDQIICSKNTVDLYNPKTIQASMGAIYEAHIHYRYLLQILPALKAADYILTGASLTGENIYQTSFKEKTALIMGSESHGISTEIMQALDQAILIPKYGTAESLNVGIATGIILAEYKRQLP